MLPSEMLDLPSLMVSNDFRGPCCAVLESCELERVPKSSRRAASRLATRSPSKPSLIPGKWLSPVSFRGNGVADESMETTDRIGNTRSTNPGDIVDGFVGDLGGSFAPEKMLTFVCRGDIPIRVCKAAARATDCDTALPCSDRFEARELVEVLRDGGPSCCSDDMLIVAKA